MAKECYLSTKQKNGIMPLHDGTYDYESPENCNPATSLLKNYDMIIHFMNMFGSRGLFSISSEILILMANWHDGTLQRYCHNHLTIFYEHRNVIKGLRETSAGAHHQLFAFLYKKFEI